MTDTSVRRSIPTRYGSQLFRSKLEADWALTFDQLGIPWEYEREGRYFGTVFYLPDFQIKPSGQYVEVKGQWEPADVKKAQALCAELPPQRHEVVLVRAEPNGRFWGWPRVTVGLPFEEFLTESVRELALLHCKECGVWWFAVEDDDYSCRHCFATDDWLTVEPHFARAITPWPYVAPRVW